jgi:hypothetical protein
MLPLLRKVDREVKLMIGPKAWARMALLLRKNL